MDAVRRNVRGLLADQSGATAIEYGLIAALIAVAASSAIAGLGGGSNGMWTGISQKFTAASS